MKSEHADKMAVLWSRYVVWSKFWSPAEPINLESFTAYLKFFHYYDINS